MDAKEQDRIWNELSEQNRKTLQFEYQDYIDDIEDSEVCDIERANLEGRVKVMKALFGTHNLKPKPPTPKTWEDVEKLHEDYYYIGGETSDISDALKKKAIATLKIAKLIKLSYGGMVSEEEQTDGWEILPIQNELVIGHSFIADKPFVFFHTRQQAEEFMSHESNKILLRQYYMI